MEKRNTTASLKSRIRRMSKLLETIRDINILLDELHGIPVLKKVNEKINQELEK